MSVFKRENIALVILSFFAMLVGAQTEIIGSTVGNGDFQNNDPFEAYHGTTPVTVTSNATGRRLISSSSSTGNLIFPGWRADRDYYNGGNPAWGVDGSTKAPVPGWPNVYFFMNSGDVTLVSETRAATLFAGDTVSISFELNGDQLLPTAPASCAGQIDFGGGQTFSWSAADASIAAADVTLNFSTNFTLTAPASQATLTLNLSTGRDGASSDNQTKLDNVSVIVTSGGGGGPPAGIYVATTGDDIANDGSFGSPYRTIQKAANVAVAGDTVYIRGGTYRETVSLPRSGTSGNPISFVAYAGEDVVLSAGDLVSGWSVHSGDIWKANCNWDVGSNGDGNTLFVGGDLKFEAREGAETDPLDLSDWGYIASGQMKSTYFTASDLSGWGDDYWNGAKVRHYRNDWTTMTSTITDYRSSDGRVYFNNIGVVSQKHALGYYIFGTLKALDRAGEWFKDTSTDTLYYQVPSGQDPNTLQIEFRKRDYGFDARSRAYIRISGITFRGLHIQTDGSTDYNTYEKCLFYGYDKNNYGRFWLTGDHNLFRDNEVKQSWGAVATVSGDRNEIVNNYCHDIGFFGTSRVLSMSGTRHLVAYNTVRKIARSFLDGYPSRSEFAYNLFEDGARLSWDTGFFDGDSGRGNGGGCIVHHNVFRDSNGIGIFCASYAGLDFVHHHNMVYDVTPGGYFTYRLGQLQFGKFYHNTLVGAAPEGDVNASGYAYESAYNNNLQISLDRCASLGVDFRGNVNYSTSDFVDFNNRDLRLAAGSAAIDAGIELPGINEGFAGAAPDAGALEYGEAMWPVGHNFASPPDYPYAWVALPGSNLFEDNLFSSSLQGWTYTGSPTRFNANTWNTLGTGYGRSGSYSIRFNPGDGMRRTFTGLKPNTWYTVATETRLTDHKLDMEQYDGISGSVSTGSHRNEAYITGLGAGEWVRYDGVGFGAAGKYDQLQITFTRPAGTTGAEDATLEVRSGSPTGALLCVIEYNPKHADSWIAATADIAGLEGAHSLYFLPKGSDAATMMLATVRLQHSNMATDDRLSVSARNIGGGDVTSLVGKTMWPGVYETFRFKTGPAATSVELDIMNHGAYDAYLDRLALFEKDNLSENVAAAGTVRQSSTGVGGAGLAVDGNPATRSATMDQAYGWWDVDLGAPTKLYGLRLTAPNPNPEWMGDFRVTIWDTLPTYGGLPIWSRDYLKNAALSSGETLVIKDSDASMDGQTLARDAVGRYVRVESLSTDSSDTSILGLAELEARAFDETNMAATDADVDEGTSSWSATFAQLVNIGEIEIINVDAPNYGELSNFKVSVWDRVPSEGGSKVWERDYFASGSVDRGARFRITGDDVATDGRTRLASTLGRYVLIALNGNNNEGTPDLTFEQVAIRDAATVRPIKNVALYGTAAQSANHYSTHGFADTAINSIVLPQGDFTTAAKQQGAWWQVDLNQTRTIDQIVVFNRTDAADRLGNFRVSVWNGTPGAGGARIWYKDYSYYSGDIPAGGSLTIDGSATSSGTRLDALTGARLVRVELLGDNLLSLPEVQVWDVSAAAPPVDAALYIQAEDYAMGESFATYSDTTPGNAGGVHRTDDVDLYDRAGALCIGAIADGEWTAYRIDLSAGTYDLVARVSCTADGRTLVPWIDPLESLAALPIPNTGGSGTFQTVTLPNIVVAEHGPRWMWLEFFGGDYNIDWVAFVPRGGDGDANGMRDDWETEFLGGMGGDPGLDPDGDGFLNGEESIAGTHPQDGADYPKIIPAGEGFSWDAKDGRIYTIYRADSLTNPFSVIQSDVIWPQTNFVDAEGLNEAFYRLEVSVP